MSYCRFRLLSRSMSRVPKSPPTPELQGTLFDLDARLYLQHHFTSHGSL